jgi:hypothetical protein
METSGRIEVKSLTHNLLSDAEMLFDSSPETHGCSCTWFLILADFTNFTDRAYNLPNL